MPYLGAGLLVALVLLAWCNCFHAPFVFDDAVAVVHNPSIRHLWPLTHVLAATDSGATTTGRPLLNLSFALNYAVGGEAVVGYHVVNVLIHILGALTLFGLTRRLLVCPPVPSRVREAAAPVAFSIAALWAVHPLQTEAVMYIAQRAESLASLFYLLTLYGVVRGATEASRRWSGLAVVACAAGMLTKEIVATAPVLALLLDRTFFAGSVREAWRRRAALHGALAATWLLLLFTLATHAGRGGTAGFSAGMPWTNYALTQSGAVLHYLRLTVWPAPLVFDYGAALAPGAASVAFTTLLVLALIAVTGVALWRWPVAGFLGAWYLVLLAPSSSVIPIASQTVAEHRVCLALAAPIAGLVALLWRALPKWRGVAVAVFVTAATTATLARNHDYRSGIALWRDTVAKRPDNPRAHFNLGLALAAAGDAGGAIAQYRAAIRLDDRNAEVHLALAQSLGRAGEVPQAMAELRRAIALAPGLTFAHAMLGDALSATQAWAAAATEYETVLALQPSAEAHYKLAGCLIALNRAAEALPHYAAAVQLDPNRPDIENDYASALAQLGRIEESLPHLQVAVRLDPADADTRVNLATVLLTLHRPDDARQQVSEALRLQPNNPDARSLLTQLTHP